MVVLIRWLLVQVLMSARLQLVAAVNDLIIGVRAASHIADFVLIIINIVNYSMIESDQTHCHIISNML